MRGLILAYHSQNCGGYGYSDNDHCAFRQDLQLVHDHELPIIPLKDIAVSLSTGCHADLPRRFVAFSCDDGTILDWRDYQHPQFGWQRSFANILRDHMARHDLQGKGLLTAFVIASAIARSAIDQGCYEGNPLSSDDWWPDAAREGLIAIENHSWDHVHPVLPDHMVTAASAGNFHAVDTYEQADLQVREASQFINQRLAGTGHRASLFAYPYGHESSYLSETYLPQYKQQHGIVGAFTTEHRFVDATTQAFKIPRLVCGDAWQTPAQLADILERLLH